MQYKIDNKVSHMPKAEKECLMKRMHEYHELHSPGEDVMIAIEEMAELTQVLSKLKRGKIESDDISLIEEVADVKCSLNEIARYAFGLEKSDKAFDEKAIKTAKAKDEHKERDEIFVAMSRMAKLSNRLSKLLYGKKSISNDELSKYILDVKSSISGIIERYNLDVNKIKYIEDVKMDRTRERLKNGTD
jgi:hypothetical protein